MVQDFQVAQREQDDLRNRRGGLGFGSRRLRLRQESERSIRLYCDGLVLIYLIWAVIWELAERWEEYLVSLRQKKSC